MVQFSISQEILRADFAEMKDDKRSVMNGARTFFDSRYLNNRYRFLRNNGPLKIRLPQCYVVLWTHNINAICKSIRNYESDMIFVTALKSR